MNFSQDVATQIVGAIKEVCGYNVNFIDINGIIYASTDKNRIGTYHEIGHKVALSRKVYKIKKLDNFEGTKEGINVPLIYNNEVLAVIGISGPMKKVEAFSNLAIKISLLILNEHELLLKKHNEQRRNSYLFKNLLNEDVNEDKLASTYKIIEKDYGIKPITPIHIVTMVLKTDDLIGRYINFSSFMEKLIPVCDSTLYRFSYPNRYYFIVKKQGLRFNELKDFASTNNESLTLYLSDAAMLQDLKKLYLNINLLIDCIKQSTCLVTYDDNKFRMLLASAKRDVIDSFRQQTIKNLNSKQLKVLSVFFKQNCSLKETASELGIHINTLQYNLNQIYAVTSLNPRQFIDAARLYSAILLSSE